MKQNFLSFFLSFKLLAILQCCLQPCWSKALFCSSRIWWKTVAMSGRASTDSMKSSEFGVCDRRRRTVRWHIVPRLEPGHEERKDWSPRGKCAGSPGLGPSCSFYLMRLLSGVDVVAARLEIKGVDGEPSFGFFHLLQRGIGGEQKGKHHHRQRGESRRKMKEARKFPLIFQ